MYPHERMRRASPNDPTLDAHGPASLNAPTPTPPTPGVGPRVHLVRGSSSGISAQTQSLLRNRLLGAATVIFVGASAFWLRTIIDNGMQGVTDPDLLLRERLLFFFQGVQVLVVGLVSLWLWRGTLGLRQLRLAELLVFGWTGAFFVGVQHFQTLLCARQFNFIYNPIAIWLMLTTTYGMFIPNTWRRAALILGGMFLAPLVTTGFDMLGPEIAADLTRFSYFGQHLTTSIMMLALCYGVSVYGTHILGTLRREVYEARQLGQYKLKSLLGSGGMGEVYLAEHQLLKRPCAIKLIHPSKAADPRALARFEREVRATAALSHWNTVEVFDYGSTDDGTFYYVMEYLPGLSLADLVDRYGPLPPARVIHLLAQTCGALAEAHAAGLIHRDIKPGNIFAAHRGGVHDVAKLLDFGLAKPLVDVESLQLTQEGSITGSPLYMSPEQAQGDTEPDARGDIYSLGCVAYHMLTGRPPFEGDKPMKVLIAHAREEVVPPSRLRSDVPDDLEQVVLRCLAKRPEDRYPSAIDLGAALAECRAAGDWNQDLASAWWGTSGATARFLDVDRVETGG